jgi:hypothetical protein
MARTAKIEVYPSVVMADGVIGGLEYRWRYRATNGRIMADGGEGYVDRRDCVLGALKVLGLQVRQYRRQARDMGIASQASVYPRYAGPGGLYYFFSQTVTGRDADIELVRRDA